MLSFICYCAELSCMNSPNKILINNTVKCIVHAAHRFTSIEVA